MINKTKSSLFEKTNKIGIPFISSNQENKRMALSEQY